MCTSPITYYVDKNGVVGYSPKEEASSVTKGIHGCGNCTECRQLDRNQRTVRAHFEASQWPSNLFVTLTYNDDHLPLGGTLDKKDVQDFMKRLKKRLKSTKDNPIRQIYAGEYGDDGRPHYHLILFNCEFKDMFHHRNSDDGFPIYRSHILEKLWPFGFSEFTYAHPDNIAYVYKYIMKKVQRKYRKPYMDLKTGLIQANEFVEASRNPGIGACLRNSRTLEKGYLMANGRKYPIPLYYIKYLKKHNKIDILTRIEQNAIDRAELTSKPTDTKREEYYTLVKQQRRTK